MVYEILPTVFGVVSIRLGYLGCLFILGNAHRMHFCFQWVLRLAVQIDWPVYGVFIIITTTTIIKKEKKKERQRERRIIMRPKIIIFQIKKNHNERLY